MPVVQTVSPLKSPPSNAYGLVQYLSQRLPGYDPSEHLRELNSGYVHVWEEITKLKNHYFTNIKTVTVAKAQFNYDLQFNADGGLNAPLSPRLYQITKIRVQPPAGGLFQSTRALTPNEPDFLSISANATGSPSQTGPYYWYLSGRGQLNWGLPLAVGTTLEITYTFFLVNMTFLQGGTVSSSGNTVTGNGTAFTAMVPPDFQAYLPTSGGQEEIQAELICNPTSAQGGQVYRVTAISSDTSLTTATAISPALPAGSAYVLATLPEIPREHIRVIASIALTSMYSVAGDDARVSEWTAKSATNLQLMKDALIERQSNNPPRKQRFPGSIANARNRTFLR